MDPGRVEARPGLAWGINCMKRLLPVLIGLLAGCGSPTSQSRSATDDQQSTPPPLAHFEFRGLKPDQTSVKEAEKAKSVVWCENFGKIDPHTTTCRFDKYSIGDISAGNSTVSFKDSKFDWFSIKYPTDSFGALLDQTIKIYGKPCSLTTEQLQNGFGAKFQGDVVKWCFSEGKLTVRRHAQDDYRFGEFEFFTARAAPPAKEYNASTL